MRLSPLIATLALTACRPTASIGAAQTDGASATGSSSAGSETSGSGPGSGTTGSESTGAGPGGTDSGSTGTSGSPTGTGFPTSSTGGPGTGTSVGPTGGGGDPCSVFWNPMLCFDNGCVWSFPGDSCQTPDMTGDTGGAVPPACQPHPNDEPCVDCLKMSCCQALESCSLDADCTCLLNCIVQNNDPLQCQGVCQPSNAGGYLAMCAGNACFPVCG